MTVTTTNNGEAYFLANQVLLRLKPTGSSVSIPRWIVEPKLRELLESLVAGVKFSDDEKGQFLIPLADGSVLAQLTLLNGDVGTYVQAGVEFLNGGEDPHGLKASLRTLGLELTTVVPNWLSGGSPQVIGTGGPGTRPVEIASAGLQNVRINIQNGARFADGATARDLGLPVDVFILDTVPGQRTSHQTPTGIAHTLDAVTDANDKQNFKESAMGAIWLMESHRPGNCPTEFTFQNGQNVLTRTWADPSRIQELKIESGSVSDGTYLEDYYCIEGHDYDMSDHGLFIAGIIKSIEPTARIHLIEVLNDRCIGSVAMIADGFRRIRDIRRALELEKGSYLVNCSFTLAVPRLGPRNPQRPGHLNLSAHPTPNLPAWLKNWLEVSGYKQTEDLLVAIASEALEDKSHAAVVAAAGNDSAGLPQPCVARYPAALPNVLGVGALAQAGGRAPYSNYPDDPKTDGLMVLGELIGLFSGAPPTTPGVGRPSGFAIWAGTSFAAPVVTGKIAQLVSAFSLTPAQAIAQLHRGAIKDAVAPGLDSIDADQR